MSRLTLFKRNLQPRYNYNKCIRPVAASLAVLQMLKTLRDEDQSPFHPLKLAQWNIHLPSRPAIKQLSYSSLCVCVYFKFPLEWKCHIFVLNQQNIPQTWLNMTNCFGHIFLHGSSQICWFVVHCSNVIPHIFGFHTNLYFQGTLPLKIYLVHLWGHGNRPLAKYSQHFRVRQKCKTSFRYCLYRHLDGDW